MNAGQGDRKVYVRFRSFKESAMRLGYRRVRKYINSVPEDVGRDDMEKHYYVLEFVPSIDSKQIKRILPLDRNSIPEVSSWWKGISSISYMSKRTRTFETKDNEVTPRRFTILGIDIRTSNIRDYVDLVSSISAASSYLHITAVRDLMRSVTRDTLSSLKRTCHILNTMKFPVRDAVDEHGRSALLNACMSDREDAVKYLLSQSPAKQQNRQVMNSIQASARHNHERVTMILLKHGHANTFDAIHLAARYASTSHLNQFLLHENNKTKLLRYLDKQGRSAASVAAEFGRLQSLKLLLQAGGVESVKKASDEQGSSIFVVAPVPLTETSKYLIQLLRERSSYRIIGKFNISAPHLESALQSAQHVIIFLDDKTLCMPSCCVHTLVAMTNRRQKSVSVALEVDYREGSSNAATQIALEKCMEASPDHAAKRELFDFMNTTQHTVVPFFKFSKKRQESEVAVRSLLQAIRRFVPTNATTTNTASFIKAPPSYTQLVSLPCPHANATALCGSIRNNHQNTFDELIQRGVDVNLRTPTGTFLSISTHSHTHTNNQILTQVQRPY